MNGNRVIVKTTCSGLALATATSILLSGIPLVDEAKAGDLLSGALEAEETGVFSGAVAATSQIHKEVIREEKEARLQQEQESEEPVDWSKKLMANVRTTLNVRSQPGTNSEIIGKMRSTDMADIISWQGDWIEIESGDIKGFVSAQYALVGAAVEERAQLFGKKIAVSKVGELNVRSEASTSSTIISKLQYNQGLELDTEAAEYDGWVGVKSEYFTGYVYGQYIEIKEQEIGTAISLEEERAQQLAALSAQIAARPNVIYGDPVPSTPEDEVLLAALLMCEAGSSFDGMLAVGGVVINRLKAGYGPTIYDVIYQRGQFTPAGNGKVSNVIAAGVTDLALAAARQAISGVDITGGCRSFRAAWTGHAGTNIGGNVFF